MKYKYTENIVFFYGFTTNKLEYCDDFIYAKSNTHFAEDRNRYFYYDNEGFRKKILLSLQENSSNFIIEDIQISVSVDGFVNIKLSTNGLPEDFDADRYDFEESYTILDNYITNLLFEKNSKYFTKNTHIMKIDFESRYLFHQHIDKEEEKENQVEIKWSLYEYPVDTSLEIKKLYIDVDTYVIETNLLYMVYSYIFLYYMKQEPSLKESQTILIDSRRRIAEHTFFYNEFSTKAVEIMKEKSLFEKHNTPYTQKIYEKLDKDFEDLTQSLENERQDKHSNTLNKIILVLTTVNLLSIILAILSLMFTVKKSNIDTKMYYVDIFTFFGDFLEIFFYTLIIVGWIAVICASILFCSRQIKYYLTKGMI